MNKFFNSKYPILEACMYGGSDLKLALACWNAGIYPSLLIPDVLNQYTVNYDLLGETLTEYKKSTGACDIVLAIGQRQFFDLKLMDMIKSYKVSHVEFFPLHDDSYDRATQVFGDHYDKALSAMAKHIAPVQVMSRTRKPFVDKKNFAYCLKGSDGAGLNGELNTAELFEQQKKLTPDAVLIPYGGVGTPKQVADYIRTGATAVAVGTLLAASLESPLSQETKEAMCRANKSDINKFNDTNQNALVLGDPKKVQQDKSHWNRTDSFFKGLYGDGKTGHIYAGNGIDHVNSIKSVKEIVEYLTSEL